MGGKPAVASMGRGFLVQTSPLLLDNLSPTGHNRGVSEVKASHFAHDRLILLSSPPRSDQQFVTRTFAEEVQHVRFIFERMP
jgi:hypothetical protein